MTLTEDDYKVMIGEKALDVIQQSSYDNRIKAEKTAQEEMSGYLRARYDVGAIFTATDDKRNDIIVMYLCDITLYHLISWLPNKMGFELREKRYKAALEWLDKVQQGKIMPALPTPTSADGEEDYLNPIRYGAGQKNNYDW